MHPIEDQLQTMAHLIATASDLVSRLLAAQVAMVDAHARLLQQHQQLVETEQTQQRMAEALHSASAALTSTLDYNQVIDRILEQVRCVIPSDTSNVMIIEDRNVARVFRGHGYSSFGTAETLTSTTLTIDTVAGLRHMISTREPLVVPDVANDTTWVYSRPEHVWIRSYVGAPIVVRENVIGFLNAMSATPHTYDQHHAKRLQTFAFHAAIAIENAHLYRRAQEEIAERIRVEAELRRHRDDLEELVKERTAEVHRLAITDPLTDLFNRRHVMLLGERALHCAAQHRQPLSVLMVDIDHFKAINDTYGHAVGDEVLRLVSTVIRAQIRSSDIIGRYGGEEFVVLMPDTPLHKAQQIAERLLNAIRALDLTALAATLHITASIGAAVCSIDSEQTLDTLIDHADQAMYSAKRGGRDRTFMYG